LEFDAPVSCEGCLLSYKRIRRYGDGYEQRLLWCVVTHLIADIGKCPLKIVPDGTTETVSLIAAMSEPLQAKFHETAQDITATGFVGFTTIYL